MIYGHSGGASAANDAVARGLSRASGSWGGYQAWRKLEPDHRLALIEEALKAANDIDDGFPIAL